MNPENRKPLNPDILLLAKYFPDIPVRYYLGKLCENHFIKSEYYDQIEELLSGFKIYDQQCIINFSFLVNIFWGQRQFAIEDQPEDENHYQLMSGYFADCEKLVNFLKDHEIESIHFKGNIKDGAKGYEPDKVCFTNQKFIKETLGGLSKLIQSGVIFITSPDMKYFKRSQGSKIQLSGRFKIQTFFYLQKFLHDLPYPELNDLSEPDENYFAGKLFIIAGIIKPKPYTKAYKNKTERYYLIKTMQKLR
jgi:hypothetical protein